MLILANVIVLSFAAPVFIWVMVALGLLLLLLSRKPKVVIAVGVMYGAIYLGNALFQMTGPAVQSVWAAISIPIVYFLPFLIYAALLGSTTSIGEASAALHRTRIPVRATVPLLVFFRFVPTIGREFRSIRVAMRLRGSIGRGNPFRALEYLLVPLLFSLVRTGEELTVAALTRGLGLKNDRTHVSDPRIRALDVGLVLVLAALLVAALLTRSR